VNPAARRGFRVWAASAALSTLGDAITFFALVWVAASHGPGVASLTLTVGSVPLCLLVLAGGLAADRWGLRVVMVGCDIVMAAVMCAFALGALWEVPVWALVVVSFVSGTAAGLRRPAAGVFPRLFARDDELTRVMATMTLLMQLAYVTGPVLAGALLAWGGLALTSGIDSVSFALVGLVLLAVRPPLAPERPAAADRWSAQLREGVHSASTAPGVPATVLAVCGLAVSILPLVELCVPLAGHARGWGVTGTSMVAGAWPVGGMTVMAVVTRRGAPGPRTALAAGGHVAVGVVAVLLVGVGTSMTTARLFPRFIDATPEAMLARFHSLLQLAQIAPVLVATPVLGWLAAGWGVGTPLVLMAGVLLATTLAVQRSEVGLSRIADPERPAPRSEEACEVE
jgi:MFS family permease